LAQNQAVKSLKNFVCIPPEFGLLKLLSNANKFTERGTISVHARQAQENGRDWVTIVVADAGIGMTPEQMGNFFRSFRNRTHRGGTGLGQLGRGSIFRIRLPKIADAPKEAAPITLRRFVAGPPAPPSLARFASERRWLQRGWLPNFHPTKSCMTVLG
jgi:hypothetical protein